MIDTNKVQFAGTASGFENHEIDVPFSANYSGGNIASGSYVGPIRASISLDNSEDISHVVVRLSGIETFFRVVNGYFQIDYPNRDIAFRQYSIQVSTYYSSGSLIVDAYVINQYFTTVSVPGFTLECIASLYRIPTRVA